MSEITQHAEFNQVRYAQVWEDADILTEALQATPGGRYLSVASAGDNALALLLLAPEDVVALDLNPTQIYCLELRVAAIKTLQHKEFIQLMGSLPCDNRAELFEKIKPLLTEHAVQFWQQQNEANRLGYAHIGKFEHYFSLFRQRVLPLVHSQKTINELLAEKTVEQAKHFYENRWNNWRWRLLFRLFFSRTVMGKLGRDPAFFKYVEGSVATRIFNRAEHALKQLQPHKNPYLQWILKGRYTTALPLAWREEHYATLQKNIGKLHWHCTSIEQYLADHPASFDGFNLSDIFEYMSEQAYTQLLSTLTDHASTGANLVYWNMLAPRTRPDALSEQLEPQQALADKLHQQDKAFFYSRLVIEKKQ